MSWPAHFESPTGSPCCTKAHFLRWGPKTRSAAVRIPASGNSSIGCLAPPLIFNQPRNTWKVISRATGESYEDRSKSGGLRSGVSHHPDIHPHLFDDDQFPYRERAVQDLSSLCRWTRSGSACPVWRHQCRKSYRSTALDI